MGLCNYSVQNLNYFFAAPCLCITDIIQQEKKSSFQHTLILLLLLLLQSCLSMTCLSRREYEKHKRRQTFNIQSIHQENKETWETWDSRRKNGSQCTMNSSQNKANTVVWYNIATARIIERQKVVVMVSIMTGDNSCIEHLFLLHQVVLAVVYISHLQTIVAREREWQRDNRRGVMGDEVHSGYTTNIPLEESSNGWAVLLSILSV